MRVVTAEGAEDFVPFDARPASESLTYEVDVSRAAGLRLVADTFFGGRPAPARDFLGRPIHAYL